MVDPSPLPIYFWLRHGKPWVPKDCFLFPEFGEVELKIGIVGPCLDLEVGVEAELSAFVFCTVDV